MRILVVKLSSIGDLVHTLPAVAALRQNFPAAEICWAVESRSAEILRGTPVVDHLIEIDTRAIRGGRLSGMLPELRRQARLVRRMRCDIAIDFQGLIKSAAIARLSGAKRRIGFGTDALRESAARFLYTETFNVPQRTHVIAKNLALASQAFSFRPGPEAPFNFPIYSAPADREEAAQIAASAGGEFAILNPAGGWVTKLWHSEKFGALADRIYREFGMRSVVVTGPNESELAQRVAANASPDSCVLAEPSLKGFYELAKLARVYVGGDTGPTHIAIAAGARVVGLFGPTEWWRNGSLNAEDIVVERSDIGCRIDCHRRTCSAWICMDSEVDDVAAAVSARLAPRVASVV